MIGTGGGNRARFQEVQQRPLGEATLCRSIHLELFVQPGKDGSVIHLASTVDGHYLWAVCLSEGVFCRDIIMALTYVYITADWYLPSGNYC